MVRETEGVNRGCRIFLREYVNSCCFAPNIMGDRIKESEMTGMCDAS